MKYLIALLMTATACVAGPLAGPYPTGGGSGAGFDGSYGGTATFGGVTSTNDFVGKARLTLGTTQSDAASGAFAANGIGVYNTGDAHVWAWSIGVSNATQDLRIIEQYVAMHKSAADATRLAACTYGLDGDGTMFFSHNNNWAGLSTGTGNAIFKWVNNQSTYPHANLMASTNGNMWISGSYYGDGSQLTGISAGTSAVGLLITNGLLYDLDFEAGLINKKTWLMATNNSSANNPCILTNGVYGNAVHFDGNNDLKLQPNTRTLMNSNFTMTAWVKGSADRWIYATGPAANGTEVIYVSTGNLRLYDYTSATALTTSGGTLSDGKWHFVACTRNFGTNISMMVDTTWTNFTTGFAYNSTANTPKLMHDYGDTAHKCEIDNFQYYDYALSQTDIQNIRDGIAYYSTATTVYTIATTGWTNTTTANAQVNWTGTGTTATIKNPANTTMYTSASTTGGSYVLPPGWAVTLSGTGVAGTAYSLNR
jgi:hypothetical protein